MAKNSSYKNILSSINELKSNEVVSVFVPSVGKTVNFDPLTVKQQKDLLSSSVDTDFENLSFLNTLSEVMLANCKTPGVKILVTDKPLIALQLRVVAVGKTLTVKDDADNSFDVDLEQHVKNVTSNVPVPPADLTVAHGPIEIQCHVPDLPTDVKYNKQFTKRVRGPKTSKLKITDVIGDVYVSELVKFIKSVKVGEEIIDVDEGVSANNMVEIFENLPMQMSSKLADVIKKLREIEEIALNPAELPEELSITIDASLFTISE